MVVKGAEAWVKNVIYIWVKNGIPKACSLKYLQKTEKDTIAKEWGEINLKVNPVANSSPSRRCIDLNLKSQPVKSICFVSARTQNWKSHTEKLRAFSTFCLPTIALVSSIREQNNYHHVSLSLICNSNVISVKIPISYFVGISKLILIFIWRYQGPRIAKIVLKRNNKVGRTKYLK